MVNIDELARKIQKDSCPNMKLQDIKAVLMGGLKATTELLVQGNTVKLHKTAKLEPVHTEGRKSFDGINKRYYDRPPRTHVRFTPLSALEDALKGKGGNF